MELSETDLHALADEHAARWATLDPLLPAQPPLNPADGLLLAAEDDGGRAVAVVRRIRTDPDDLGALWSALDAQVVSLRVTGPDPAGAVDRLLADVAERTAREPFEDDSAVSITWPARDAAPLRSFTAHGLAPLLGVVARPAGRPMGPGGTPSDVRIRVAAADDVDAVTALRLEVQRYDQQFGLLADRPKAAELLREHTLEVLGRGDDWTWVAVRDGRTVGMIAVDKPPHADWVAPLTSAAPVGYVDCLGTAPEERGAGVGTALLAVAHQALDEAGVAVTLLHHAVPNPLSTPLYARHGYRPLWTTWAARPAQNLR